MNSAIVKKNRPELVTIGDRSVSTHGWRLPLVEEHLKEHLGRKPSKKKPGEEKRDKRWCDMNCAARTFFGRSGPQARSEVRRRVGRAFRSFLPKGLFIAIEYKTGKGGHGEILAMKLYEADDATEKSAAELQVERMRVRRVINEQTFQDALALLGVSQSPEPAATL